MTISYVEADAIIIIRVKVLAETAGLITKLDTVASGEEDIDEKNIRAFRTVNVVTPNNGRSNYSFEIKGISIFVSIEITIFNR